MFLPLKTRIFLFLGSVLFLIYPDFENVELVADVLFLFFFFLVNVSWLKVIIV